MILAKFCFKALTFSALGTAELAGKIIYGRQDVIMFAILIVLYYFGLTYF